MAEQASLSKAFTYNSYVSAEYVKAILSQCIATIKYLVILLVQRYVAFHLPERLEYTLAVVSLLAD